MLTNEHICRSSTYGVIHWAEQHMLHSYFNGIPKQVGGGRCRWISELEHIVARIQTHAKSAKQTHNEKAVRPHLSAPKILNVSL
jgi:hypothetical protein